MYNNKHEDKMFAVGERILHALLLFIAGFIVCYLAVVNPTVKQQESNLRNLEIVDVHEVGNRGYVTLNFGGEAHCFTYEADN